MEPEPNATPEESTPPSEQEATKAPDAASVEEPTTGGGDAPSEAVTEQTEAAAKRSGDESAASETEDPAASEAGDEGADEKPGEGEKDGEAVAAKGKRKKKKAKKRVARRRPPPKAPEPPLPPELKAEAREAALARLIAMSKSGAKAVTAALDMLERGLSIPFIARFRRRQTNGFDERRLRGLRDEAEHVLRQEERRVGIRELLKQRGALTDETAAKLASVETIPEMEDLAAPYLPVTASRATVARGQGLEPLADAIRAATETQPLSEVGRPFVGEGADGTAIDKALGGARDIIAEEFCLAPKLRARLRSLFRKEGKLNVTLRSERKGDAGRHANLIGLEERVSKIPALKILAVRRAEKERVVVSTIEPPEEKALAIIHELAAPESNPHAGFLRAAGEDGYRRILKPLLQKELRDLLKRRADALAMETYERNLRNLLLGPRAGARRTLGLRPDVTNGHHWCAVDEGGLPVGCGMLPHEPTAGREACIAELQQVMKTYEVSAVAVGTTGGRAEAVSLAKEAAGEGVDVAEVADGGTRTLEALGPLELDERPTITPECRGAMSLACRFQDPLAELIRIEPKALALGPHLHDVHQGRLRRLFDDVITSCVAYVGPDPAKADAHLMARVPGFDAKSAEAFVTWRSEHGPLTSKAGLAAAVGPEIAEQAAGFLRLSNTEDPRDRTQLHPEQYGLIERMAQQVDTDVATLFEQPQKRAQVQLDALTGEDADLHTLKYVLFQATAGSGDPRPWFQHMIPPPPEITLDTLQPGLALQGKVLRAVPFGVFVDCGFGSDALIPTPHIGDRPGVEPATVAPVGAIVTARVLEIDPKKKKLTLTMRRDARPGGRGPARGPRGPRGARREGDRGPRRDGDRAPRRPAGQRGPGGPGKRPTGRPKRKPGKYQKSGGGFFDRGGRGGRGPKGPRSISLKAEEPKLPDADTVDESKLSPEELMKRKLEQMKRKFEGDSK